MVDWEHWLDDVVIFAGLSAIFAAPRISNLISTSFPCSSYMDDVTDPRTCLCRLCRSLVPFYVYVRAPHASRQVAHSAVSQVFELNIHTHIHPYMPTLWYGMVYIHTHCYGHLLWRSCGQHTADFAGSWTRSIFPCHVPVLLAPPFRATLRGTLPRLADRQFRQGMDLTAWALSIIRPESCAATWTVKRRPCILVSFGFGPPCALIGLAQRKGATRRTGTNNQWPTQGSLFHQHCQ
ncbi:hypothetical protein L209DRAFT_506707 [Thermothelomyces heterothallicus CBS 203.75]